MKKIIKRIIPLLLIVALIASSCWYIFVYDRETVRDFLMAQARNCSQNGDFEAATWFYDNSYEFAGEDENVAIDLAQIYKDTGNYTKAEYTLASAIADGATSELYIALCQTYVEQDKLLDAVNMLDKVADPVIKAELDALRPAAPQPDFVPGFYSQYISLNFAHDSGTLYVSTDGENPSTAQDPCVTPVALEGGETKIYAVTVGENGLVSPLSILSYTIGGVVEEVQFADVYIEELIQDQLMFGADTAIYSDDLWAVTRLTVPATAIDLSDLRHLLFLEELTIQGWSISSLSFLEGAPSLKKLDLTSNAVGNLSVLATIPTLESLELRDNAVRDLTPLTGLTDLTSLNLAENVISDISPLASCLKLGTLDVSDNKISSIAAVQTLTGLSTFRAEKNQITDCAPLAMCVEIRRLDISHNLIPDISMLSSLSKMTEFDFSYNQATALPALPSSAALVTVDGSYNQLSSLEPLDKLSALNYVNMDYYAEVSQIAFRANNPNMVQINVFGTKVTQSQANKCLDHSIIVNYDPT